MRKFQTVAVILLLSCFGLADSVVSIQPISSNVTAGSSFAVDVSISSVADLAAFTFDIGFNPNVLSATSVTEGSFLSTAGSTFFIPGTIDNVGGGIIFNFDSLLGPDSVANGSGVLVVIDFNAVAAGSSGVNLANVVLLDSNGNSLNFSTTNGNVNVGKAAVPEPPSWQMAVYAFLALTPVFIWRFKQPNDFTSTRPRVVL